MGDESRPGTDKRLKPFLGEWEKVARAGDEKYPQELTISEPGLYYGESKEGPYHPVWDSGRFEVLDSGRVELATSNDDNVVYAFKASPDLLIFKDSDGCEVKYRRRRVGRGETPPPDAKPDAY